MGVVAVDGRGLGFGRLPRCLPYVYCLLVESLGSLQILFNLGISFRLENQVSKGMTLAFANFHVASGFRSCLTFSSQVGSL